MKTIDRIVNILSRIGMWLAVFSLFFLTIVVTVGTLCRYLFNMPILGVDEISGYLNLLIGMLALSFTLQKERHVRIDIITKRLSERMQMKIEVVAVILALILLSQLMYTSWYTWIKLIATDERAQTFLRTPISWPYGFMMLGWALLIIAFVVHLTKSILKLRQL
jgi:TRAP-type C4-dicarboxylate transport system permease small subunit